MTAGCPDCAARPFEPDDRLVGARLQQMHQPNRKYQLPMEGSRGLRRMACSERDCLLDRPGEILHWPRWPNAPTQLRSDASAISYSGMASAYRPCARSSCPLAKCAIGLRGDAAKLADQLLRARDIGGGGVGHVVHPGPRARLANALCASTERGSSANARSNRPIASAYLLRDTGFIPAARPRRM